MRRTEIILKVESPMPAERVAVGHSRFLICVEHVCGKAKGAMGHIA